MDALPRLPWFVAVGASVPIIVAEQGDRFHAGAVYIGEPAAHLTLAARSIGEMVQDPERDYRNGMPESATGYNGPIDTIGSPADIGRAIVEGVRQPSGDTSHTAR